MTTGRLAPHVRRPVEDLVFDGFPCDGSYWWLRWVDYGGSGGAHATASIRVHFSRLTDAEHEAGVLDLALGSSLTKSEDTLSCLIPAGWLPVLPIGTVVRDGQVVSRLGSETRQFKFSAQTHKAAVEIAIGSPLYGPPTNLPVVKRLGLTLPKTRPPPLSRDTYRLWFAPRARVVTIGPLDDAGATKPFLVMPCPEIFRTFYAPHSALANAFLSGPWGVTQKAIADSDRTISAAGEWRVVLGPDIGEEFVPLVGNLCRRF